MKLLNKITLASVLFVSVLAVIVGCDKNKVYDTYIAPDGGVHFIGLETQVYRVVTNPATPIILKVGATDVVDVDRTVTLNITSPTGAVAGTQYTVTTATVTIGKGQTTGELVITPNYNSYNDGLERKDTLIAALTGGPDTKIAPFLDTIKLVLRGACSEGDIGSENAAGLAGTYTKTYENGSYGPYNTTISGITAVNATSARATITRIYDYDAMKAEVIFDWSVPGSYKVSVVPDIALPFTVGGLPLFSGPQVSGALGSFTYCNNKLTIPLRLYTSAGTFDEWVMTMER